MPLGSFRLNGLSKYFPPAAPSDPVFGAGSAKPIWGLETNTAPSNTSSWIITVPTTTQVDDLLLLFGAATDDRNVTPPSGWTEIADQKNGGLSASHIFWRRATAADAGGNTYTYVPQSAGRYNNTCINVRGGDNPNISTATVTTTNSPATNNVTGSGNSLYISFIGARNLNAVTYNNRPSGHDLINFQYTNGSFVALSGLYSTATSNNPGNWSFSASTNSVVVGWSLRC
jgi:hypothetical protein